MHIPHISKADMDLLERLSGYQYPELSLEKTAGPHDKKAHDRINDKLKEIADAISAEYGPVYGPFEAVKTTGNAIGLNHQLGRSWSGVFKGNTNKQYSAQISVVIDTPARSVIVGFFFGLAYSKSATAEKRETLETGLLRLGGIMHDAIMEDEEVKIVLEDLIETGFKCFAEDKPITLTQWISRIKINPRHCSLTVSLPLDKNDIVDPELMQYYLRLCIPLMSIFPPVAAAESKRRKMILRPKTPEERAEEARLKTLTGIKGELFALEQERIRLARLKLLSDKHPRHMSAISDSFHYDIASVDTLTKLHIEVKTTVRTKDDPLSAIAFMSAAEYEFYRQNKNTYRIYRVYDINGTPELEILRMEDIGVEPEGYRMIIPSRP